MPRPRKLTPVQEAALLTWWRTWHAEAPWKRKAAELHVTVPTLTGIVQRLRKKAGLTVSGSRAP